MTTILIVGGFGAVGREAARGLRALAPDVTVVLAGRRPDRAPELAGTTTR